MHFYGQWQPVSAVMACGGGKIGGALISPPSVALGAGLAWSAPRFTVTWAPMTPGIRAGARASFQAGAVQPQSLGGPGHHVRIDAADRVGGTAGPIRRAAASAKTTVICAGHP